MSAHRYRLSKNFGRDAAGAVAASSKLVFSESGTATPLAVFSDAGLASSAGTTVTADSEGLFGDIFLGNGGPYRVESWNNALTTMYWREDPVYRGRVRLYVTALPSVNWPGLEVVLTGTNRLNVRNVADGAWVDVGDADALINAASVTETLTGTEALKAVTPDGLAAIWQRGANITPAAGTVTLPATGGGVFNVAAGNFSAISSAQGGRPIEMVHGGASVITHNGTSCILPGAVNITVSAGDITNWKNDAATDVSGANWRCTKVTYAAGEGAAGAKTGSYTVLDSDRDAILRFSGLAADATLALPAAAGRAGFEITLVNENVFADNVANTTPFGIIVDPNAAELMDGFATRKTFAFSRITIVCDGTGWRTKSGNWRYFSGNQTITAAGSLTLAHGLRVRPHNMWVMLQNLTAEGNYTQFDILPTTFVFTDATIFGASVVPNATNLNVRFASAAAVWHVQNKTTGAVFAITPANWAAQFYAED